MSRAAPAMQPATHGKRSSRTASQHSTGDAVQIEQAAVAGGDDLQWVTDLGFDRVCRRGVAGICGVKRMLFTGAIVVGIAPDRHVGRYCYATTDDAARALAAWDGRGDPHGNWIKFKSQRGERFGPGLAADTR